MSIFTDNDNQVHNQMELIGLELEQVIVEARSTYMVLMNTTTPEYNNTIDTVVGTAAIESAADLTLYDVYRLCWWEQMLKRFCDTIRRACEPERIFSYSRNICWDIKHSLSNECYPDMTVSQVANETRLYINFYGESFKIGFGFAGPVDIYDRVESLVNEVKKYAGIR